MDRPEGSEARAWGFCLPLWKQPYKRPDGSNAVRARAERIGIVQGGYSSIHEHREQSNVFCVFKGRLLLREFIMDGQVPILSGELELLPDDRPMTLDPGLVHQFEALTEVEALELYIAHGAGSADPADIMRYSQNGVRPQVVGLEYTMTTKTFEELYKR